MRNPEIRLMDEKINIRGEMIVFFLYLGEEEHVPVQYVEWELPFSTEIICPECADGMIGNIHICPGNCKLEIKPDADGEERVVTMEAILNVDMKGYEENKMTILQDVYKVGANVSPVYAPYQYENLVIKNNAKTKVARRFRTDDMKKQVLQLIHVDGNVKIDEMEKQDDGIYVEGVIFVELLMITDDDLNPLHGMTKVLPFSYTVEAKNLEENDTFEMEAFLDQIQGTVLDGDEIEVKAIVSLDTMVFAKKDGKVIIDAVEEAFDYEKMKSIPGIAVYIAPKEEHMWDVGKMYGASVEEIKTMNQLDSDIIKPGQKIMIVKKVKELL